MNRSLVFNQAQTPNDVILLLQVLSISVGHADVVGIFLIQQIPAYGSIRPNGLALGSRYGSSTCEISRVLLTHLELSGCPVERYDVTAGSGIDLYVKFAFGDQTEESLTAVDDAEIRSRDLTPALVKGQKVLLGARGEAHFIRPIRKFLELP